MENYKNSLYLKDDVLKCLIEILQMEDRFETIEKAMTDMIICKFKGSSVFLKSKELKDTSIIECCFVVYKDKITFGVNYSPCRESKKYVKRLNNELPYLKNPIDENSKKKLILTSLTVVDKISMQNIMSAKDERIKMNILKFQIDYFFKKYANKIIHKIIEIMLNVVI